LPVGTREGQTARFIHEGYELAFEVANRDGGVSIGGRKVPLELVLEDDRDRERESSDKLRSVNLVLGSHIVVSLAESRAGRAGRGGAAWTRGPAERPAKIATRLP